MPEPIPVLVVHGVATRDSEFFTRQVAVLNSKLGEKWKLIPVIWWDLGGQNQDILDCLPEMETEEVRGLESPLPPRSDDLDAELIERLFLAPGDAGKEAVRSQDEREGLILEGAGVDKSAGVRGDGEDEAIREAVTEQLPQTRFLKHIQDPEILRAVGRTLKEAADEAKDKAVVGTESEAEELVRGEGREETRGARDFIKNLSRRLITSLDDFLGQTTGSVLGGFNQRLRGVIAEPFVRFFGDIFVYQRNQEKIHERIWQAIEQHAPGYGTKEKPIHVIAHSLGGIVCFDAALREERPLWMKSFLTFGSQSAFFHVVDPRQQLTKYSRDNPVKLPETFGNWISLWDTMDFLAFTAGKVFQLHDGRVPEDVMVTDPISLIIKDKGWTHSIYWETEELLSSVRKILGAT